MIDSTIVASFLIGLIVGIGTTMVLLGIALAIAHSPEQTAVLRSWGGAFRRGWRQGWRSLGAALVDILAWMRKGSRR